MIPRYPLTEDDVEAFIDLSSAQSTNYFYETNTLLHNDNGNVWEKESTKESIFPLSMKEEDSQSTLPIAFQVDDRYSRRRTRFSDVSRTLKP